jgi:ParB family chromosome partitioning protein|tara:strand:- start:4792 stop:5643 length:852 start_codon:yes stop_codon:yes gene_type:complete
MINPFKAKKGLGRGLSSLIGDNDIKTTKNKISISSIIKNKFQPRRNFEKEALEELTKSIKERGIIQPIIVRKSQQENGKFEIVAGERRWQAAQNAGLHEVPIVEIDIDDLKSLEFAIVENVQRSDLNPIEEAMGYQRLIDEFNYDQEKVSKFIGKSRSHIANFLRLLSLPIETQKLIEKKQLTLGHAKILVGMENTNFLAKKIVDKKLSVRQTESLVRVLKSSKKFKAKSRDSNIINLEENISDKTGLKVRISNKKNNSGNVVFEYKNIDQLNHLLMVIKANY